MRVFLGLALLFGAAVEARAQSVPGGVKLTQVAGASTPTLSFTWNASTGGNGKLLYVAQLREVPNAFPPGRSFNSWPTYATITSGTVVVPSGDFFDSGSSSNLWVKFANLHVGKTYEARVSASDADGMRSGWSAIVQVTTQDPRPDLPMSSLRLLDLTTIQPYSGLTPAFNPEIRTYTLSVPFSHTGTAFQITWPDGGEIKANGGSTGVSFSPGATVVVLSASGTPRTYTVTIFRVPSVTALALSAGALTPAFSSTVFTYETTVAAESITLTPTFSGSGITATVGLAGGTAASVASGAASGAIALEEGKNSIELKVGTSSAKATYGIAVTRASNLSFASEQADLQLHGGAAASVVLPAATGGASPYSYWLSALPAGLAFNKTTRAISGTAAAVSSTTTDNMKYFAVDTNGANGEQTFDIQVAPALSFASAPPAELVFARNTAVSETLPEISGGFTPHAYSLEGGALPTGLAFNASTRILSGTPSALADVTRAYTAKDALGTAGTASGVVTSDIRIRVVEFDLDVDDSGAITAQDGIMIARHLLGAEAVSVAEKQTGATASEVAGNIQDGVDLGMLDVDADNDTDGNDGIMIARYILGLRGDELVAGMGDATAATVEGKMAALTP